MTLIINGAVKAEDAAPVIPNATQSVLIPYQYRIAPALGTNTAIHADISLSTSSQTITTAITQPDFPRALLIKGNAASEAGNVVINGTDAAGAVISETIALNEANAVNGTVAFKSVTNIVVPVLTSAGDKVRVGTQNVLGIPHKVYNASYVYKTLFDGSTDAGTFVASTDIKSNLYTPAGTLNGVKILALVYFHE
jgi:hypothetical protein